MAPDGNIWNLAMSRPLAAPRNLPAQACGKMYLRLRITVSATNSRSRISGTQDVYLLGFAIAGERREYRLPKGSANHQPASPY
jgi:hypothetical protein